MRNISSNELWIVVAIAAAVFVACIIAKQNPSPADQDGDDSAPFTVIDSASAVAATDFTLQSTDGRTVTLSKADASGPVVIDFWATWCGPCKMELPLLDTIARKYAARGVQFYGINSDATADQIKQFFSAQSVSFPMLVDTGAAVNSAYDISSIPRVMVIDTKGRIRADDLGYDPETEKDLSACLDSLLKESSS